MLCLMPCVMCCVKLTVLCCCVKGCLHSGIVHHNAECCRIFVHHQCISQVMHDGAWLLHRQCTFVHMAHHGARLLCATIVHPVLNGARLLDTSSVPLHTWCAMVHDLGHGVAHHQYTTNTCSR